MPDTRLCRVCDGSGRVQIGDEAAATLDLVRQQPGLNAAQLARLAACAGTAMANRLVALERFGLVRGERRGRQRQWRAT